ncbi:MAG: hypothetical protein QNI90_06025 [Dinoroseobacter sp.]|nr:hypothetical protein [Dinoroseobacter sp.]
MLVPIVISHFAFISPAHAWESDYEGRLCVLSHVEESAEVRLTYDPSGPLYSISLTTPTPWPMDEVFGITFNGPAALTISTNRQTLSNGDRTLTVTDTGFGNVLSGLEQNATAVAFTGDVALPFSLDGAAPEVAEFRACLSAPTA